MNHHRLSLRASLPVTALALFVFLGATEPGCEPQHIVVEDPEGSCELASDCEDLDWPIRCPGEWTCVDNECVAQCADEPTEPEDQCSVPEDCEDLDWPIRCLGEWTCVDNECVAECADDPIVPEDECSVPEDCDVLDWPIRCLGEWTCVDNECVAECFES